MATWISTVTVYVRDQDAARAFYTEKLAFDLRMDAPMGPDSRWLEVALGGAPTGIVLYKDESRAGQFSGIVIQTDDIEGTYRQWSSRGVEFSETPNQQDWGGIQAQFVDQDRNEYVLVQLPAGFKE